MMDDELIRAIDTLPTREREILDAAIEQVARSFTRAELCAQAEKDGSLDLVVKENVRLRRIISRIDKETAYVDDNTPEEIMRAVFKKIQSIINKTT